MRNARALFEASDKSQSLLLINRVQSLGNMLRLENMPRLEASASGIPFNFLQSLEAHLNLVTPENYQTNSARPLRQLRSGLSCVYVSCLRASQREEINIK